MGRSKYCQDQFTNSSEIFYRGLFKKNNSNPFKDRIFWLEIFIFGLKIAFWAQKADSLMIFFQINLPLFSLMIQVLSIKICLEGLIYVFLRCKTFRSKLANKTAPNKNILSIRPCSFSFSDRYKIHTFVTKWNKIQIYVILLKYSYMAIADILRLGISQK